MKGIKLLLMVLMITAMIACKKDETKVVNSSNSAGGGKVTEIKEGVLDGWIKGVPWTFVSGRARKDSFNPERYRLEFWETSEDDPCNVFLPASKRSILSSMVLKAGEQILGNELNVTFSYQNDDGVYANIIATEGRFIIGEVADGIVKGKLAANFDSDHAVNGSFTLTVCE